MRTSGFLRGALVLIVIAAAADWLSAETTRLYAGKANSENAQSGAVEEEFRIHGRNVRPEIVGHGEVRFGCESLRRLSARVAPGPRKSANP